MGKLGTGFRESSGPEHSTSNFQIRTEPARIEARGRDIEAQGNMAEECPVDALVVDFVCCQRGVGYDAHTPILRSWLKRKGLRRKTIRPRPTTTRPQTSPGAEGISNTCAGELV